MSTDASMLQPIVAMVLWTMLMWCWMYATRIPALRALKMNPMEVRGTTGADADKVLPAEVQWKAHNYNHLLAEPTVFYAICLVMALLQMGGSLNVTVAWLYVFLRIAHSLVQATINIVAYRAPLFFLSSICIMILAMRAAIAVFLS